jgi:hypothetical protein
VAFLDLRSDAHMFTKLLSTYMMSAPTRCKAVQADCLCLLRDGSEEMHQASAKLALSFQTPALRNSLRVSIQIAKANENPSLFTHRYTNASRKV